MWYNSKILFIFYLQVIPTFIFLNTTVSVLHYLGVLEVIIVKIALVVRVTMGTTVGESACAAANIFLGMVRGGGGVVHVVSSTFHVVQSSSAWPSMVRRVDHIFHNIVRYGMGGKVCGEHSDGRVCVSP